MNKLATNLTTVFRLWRNTGEAEARGEKENTHLFKYRIFLNRMCGNFGKEGGGSVGESVFISQKRLS